MYCIVLYINIHQLNHGDAQRKIKFDALLFSHSDRENIIRSVMVVHAVTLKFKILHIGRFDVVLIDADEFIAVRPNWC